MRISPIRNPERKLRRHPAIRQGLTPCSGQAFLQRFLPSGKKISHLESFAIIFASAMQQILHKGMGGLHFCKQPIKGLGQPVAVVDFYNYEGEDEFGRCMCLFN
ncbi:MAG: hypothetical protein LBJ38_01110 [Oscillospiraceae bacterium]|nr:hypothetical protein [Oscillospiraceae bacterium]